MPIVTSEFALHILKRTSWLQSHPAKLAEQLVSEGQLISLRSGEWAQSEGDDRSGLFIVIDGLLHTYYAPERNRVMMLGFARPGSVLGHATRYSGGPRLVTAVCAEPSTMLEVSETALDHIAAETPDIWRAIADLTYQNLQSALRLAAEFISLNPIQRIAARLLAISGHEDPNDILVINVSQELLAEMVGASRKTVNIHLSKLETAGLVKLGYGQIEICDWAGLKNLISM